MGNAHSHGSSNGRLSRKSSRHTKKDGGPQIHITQKAEHTAGGYDKRASLPPSPTISNQANQTMDELSTSSLSKFNLPNNEQELDRLVQIHFIYKYLFGANFSAPVKDLLSSKQSRRNSDSSRHQWAQESPSISPPRVLDIACGNGTWILEMATEFPESQFYGVDLLANYPTTVKPANTTFCQCDIIQPKGLPFPDNYFDYIHMRQVYSYFTEEDWVKILKEVKRLLKPGGYIELRDIDPLLVNMGPITYKFFSEFPPLMKKWHGVNILWARRMFDLLNDVGEMVDVHRQVHALQFRSSGAVGNMIENSLRSAFQSFRLFFEKYHTLPSADYEKVIDEIVKETIKYNSYFNYYCCWGRKPLYETAYHYQELGDDSARRYSFTNNTISIDRNNSSSSSNISSLSGHRVNEKDGQQSTLKGVDETSSNNILSIYPLDQHSHIVSLAEDSVTDIDQFAEGYED